MGYLIQQSSTNQPLVFMLVSSTDHITGLTGKQANLSGNIFLSKNGGTFGAPAGATAEIAYGWYSVAANSTDNNTLGPLALHVSVSGSDPWDDLFQVVQFNPMDNVRMGMTSLPNAVPGAAGGLFIAGTNAATTISTGLTTTFTGNLTGSVGSVTGAVGSVTGAVGSVTSGVNTTQIAGSTAAATGLSALCTAQFLGVVSSDLSATTTTFTANTSTSPGLSTTSGFYASPSSVVYFYSGVDLPKAAKIVGYTYSTYGTFTVTPALPSAPASGNNFAITGIVF